MNFSVLYLGFISIFSPLMFSACGPRNTGNRPSNPSQSETQDAIRVDDIDFGLTKQDEKPSKKIGK